MKISTLLCFLLFFIISKNNAQQPTITSFTPIAAAVGDTVTITGNNFLPSGNIVCFGSVVATVTNATATYLKVTVPTGAVYKPIAVSVNNLTAYSSVFFTPSSLTCTNGSLTFGTPIDSVFDNNNPFIARDLDGDNKIDMFNSWESKLNTSKPGSFSGTMLTQYYNGNGTYLTDGDLNGDGKTDIVSTNGNSISILKNTSSVGNVSFAPTSFATNMAATNAAVGDLDVNGKPDIIIVNGDSVKFGILRNISTGNSVAYGNEMDFNTDSINISGVRVGDIDGDGKEDIVIFGNVYNSAGVWILKNTTKNNVISFARPVQLSLTTSLSFPAPQIEKIIQIELGDFDGDGKTDIAVGFEGGIFESLVDGVCILKNTSSNNISFNLPQLAGNGKFTWDGDGNEGAAFHGFAIADMDGNGKPDIVYLCSSYQYSVINSYFNFVVTLNTSTTDTISFTDLNNYSYPSRVYSIQLADMDGDGKPDVICDNQIFFTNCILPLTLLDFSAKSNGIQVALTWHTSTELNTSHFIIQHSTDGNSFTDIGTVKAIGSGANWCQFIDNNPANGVNYYRLKNVDKDGSSTYSKIVSVQLSISSNQLSVFPNPSKDKITVKGSHIASIQVIDNLGRVVKTQNLKDVTNSTLSVSGLQVGIYHLRVQTMDGKVSGVGFVKE